MTQEEKIGQGIIVGIDGESINQETEQGLKESKPGGIILYRDNYVTREQFKKLTAQLSAIAKASATLPFFVMIDEEPGGASRLDLFKNSIQGDDINWDAIEKDIEIMSELGINVDLAPLADLPLIPGTFIGNRIPFPSVGQLKSFNRKFIGLLSKHGIGATLKHFPGAGLLDRDPHKTLPKSDEPAVVLETALDIFRDGIEHGARFVMTNHAIYTWLDQSTLATFSPKIVTDLLIKKIGFNGLVITDDLSRMKAITSGVNPIEAGIQALRAGHHLIMFSHLAPKELVTIVGQLKTAAANDSLLKNRIEQNYEKIKTFKITHRLA